MKPRWGKRRDRRTPAFEPRRIHGEPRTDAPAAQGFVRSRTISPYAQVSPDLTRITSHELQNHRRRLARLFIVCVVTIALLAILVSQLTAGIGTISYSPATVAAPDEAAIKQVVNDYYASRPLERLRFLLDQKTLGQYLASRVPEIQGVQSVGADGIGTERLALEMRTPVASWRVADKTLYVDADGVSFTHDYYGPPSVEVDDESGASAASGSSAIASSSMIRYIGQLIALLKSDGTGTVTRVVLPAGMVRELDVYLQGRAYRVKVQLDRDVAGQAADVKAATTYIDAHGGASEYVDCRVEGKAYYK